MKKPLMTVEKMIDILLYNLYGVMYQMTLGDVPDDSG